MANRFRHHRFFFYDFWRKLIALCLALLVWKLVDMQLRSVVPVQQVRVKVKYDTRKYYLKEDNFLVDLEASTPSRMTQLDPELFQIEVTLPTTYEHSGIYYLKLRNRHVVKKPLRVNIKTFQPNNLAIPFDVLVPEELKVHINTQGKVKSGFEYSATCRPKTVRIIGPSQVIRNIPEVSTEPLQLSPDIAKSFSVPCAIIKPHTAVRVFPSQVTVDVLVENTLSTASQSFSSLSPAVMLPLKNNLRLAAPPEQLITIRLRGLSRSLGGIDGNQLRPFLDLSNATTPGKYQAEVRISNLPLGIEVEEISPAGIEVELIAMLDIPPPPDAGNKTETAPAQ
ncbi:MAG: CdaR family protein [Lentisphaeria bacterium]